MSPAAGIPAPSTRKYVERPKAFDYPDWWEKRRIQSNGHMKLRGEYIFVGRALEDEYVALEEVDDDVWRLIYRRTLLAMLVRRGKRLVTLSPPTDDEEPDSAETEWSEPLVTHVVTQVSPMT